MGRREELLRREAEGWDRVASLVAELSAEQQERPGLSPEGWSVRDLLWHLAFWYDDAARALEQMRAGTWGGDDPSRVPGWADRVNDEELTRSRTMSTIEAREAWLRERRRMLEALGALAELTPDAEEWFEESGPTHAAAHLPELEAWVGRLRSGR
jgi:hypothetical protein